MESCLEGKTVAEEEALATVINAGFRSPFKSFLNAFELPKSLKLNFRFS